MAEIVDILRIDIDQALRDINGIEQALDRALASVELRIDSTQAQRQLDQLAENADQALGNVAVDIDSTGAARLNDELAGVERNLAEADQEADQLAGSLREADRAAEKIDTSSKNLNTSFGGLKTAALGIASAFAAIGAGQLFAQGVRGANAAVQQFAQLEDSVNAVNVIFKEGAASVLEFGETAAESAGLSQSAFNQAVTPVGNLLQNFGFNAREAADASVILVQRAADLASVLGGDVQTALAAVSSALRGQSEPLSAYGATISAARVEQFALANGLAATKAEITDAITLQARYGLILSDTQQVAGDYAATSDDLANAQRTLGGLATDLAAKFGEALAPAFEALLAQGPALINLFASLTPALADAAGNAAAASSGFQVGAANVVLGIGGMSNAFSSFGNIIQAGAEGLKGFLVSFNPMRELNHEFDDFNTQVDEFNNNRIQDFINNAAIQIPRAIQAGTTPINAFGIAIATLAQKDDSLETVQQGFERLRIQTGLLPPEVLKVTRELLRQADALELNAGEIEFLEGVERNLNETLDDGGRANADYLASIAGIVDITPEATTVLEGLRIAAGEAGLSLTDLVLGVDPVAQALTATLTPAQETALAMQAIQTESGAAAAILDANLRPALINVSDALEDVNEDGRVSATEFVKTAEKIKTAALQLAVDLSTIAALDTSTAFQLSTLDPQIASDLISQFANDPAGLKAAAEAIFGTSDQLGEAILEVYVGALGVLQGGDTEAIASFLAFTSDITEKSVPGVTASIGVLFDDALNASFADLEVPDLTPGFVSSVDGMNSTEIVASLDAVLAASFADLEPPDLTPTLTASIALIRIEEGKQAFQEVFDILVDGLNIDLTAQGAGAASTFAFGFQEELAGREDSLKTSITTTFQGAIDEHSPSKLFLGFGERAGDAFWSGFNQADLTLKATPPAVTGTINTGQAAEGGGVNVTLITNNPTQQDEVSDVARMAQQASSIASSWRSVVPNGM